MKIKSKDIAPIVLAFFVIGITVTIFLNYWNTGKIKEPAKYTSGKFEGLYDPSDIRGSFSFADINNAFNVPAEDLAEAFGFKDAPNPERHERGGQVRQDAERAELHAPERDGEDDGDEAERDEGRDERAKP